MLRTNISNKQNSDRKATQKGCYTEKVCSISTKTSKRYKQTSKHPGMQAARKTWIILLPLCSNNSE